MLYTICELRLFGYKSCYTLLYNYKILFCLFVYLPFCLCLCLSQFFLSLSLKVIRFVVEDYDDGDHKCGAAATTMRMRIVVVTPIILIITMSILSTPNQLQCFTHTNSASAYYHHQASISIVTFHHQTRILTILPPNQHQNSTATTPGLQQ